MLKEQHTCAITSEPCSTAETNAHMQGSDVIKSRPIKWPQPMNRVGRPGEDGSGAVVLVGHLGGLVVRQVY